MKVLVKSESGVECSLKSISGSTSSGSSSPSGSGGGRSSTAEPHTQHASLKLVVWIQKLYRTFYFFFIWTSFPTMAFSSAHVASDSMTAEGIRRVTLPQLPDSAAIVRDEVVEPRAEQCIPTQAVDSHRYYSPWTKISLSKPALREQKRDALLPAYTARSHVMSISCTMNPKLVEGDTGSGKSTQVPQLIAESEADLPGTSLIWISTSRVKACMGLQERLSYVTEDRNHTKCVSAYQGTYPNVLCPREQEVVAVHTTATALLRIDHLFQECVR